MRADARRNYENLLAQAKIAFERDGVDASLEDVAKAAGVGIGTLYRHFSTRDALVEALLADRFTWATTKAGELADAADPFAALAQWLDHFVRAAMAFRGLSTQVTEVLNDPDSQLYARCHAMREAAGALLARAQEAGTARRDVTPTDVFLMAGAVSWAAERGPDDPAFATRMLAVLVDGLSAR